MSKATFKQTRFDEATLNHVDEDVQLGVGDGVAYHIGCDSYPETIRRVSAGGKTLWTSSDDFRGNGQSEYADFEKKGLFVPRDVPESEWQKYTLRQDGKWRPKGSKCGYLTAGRVFARDPHF